VWFHDVFVWFHDVFVWFHDVFVWFQLSKNRFKPVTTGLPAFFKNAGNTINTINT